MKSLSFTTGGKRWTLRFTKDPRHEGKSVWGNFDPNTRIIRVSTKCSPEIELDTTIHEANHAIYEFIDEEYVDSGSTDLKNILWKLGYRRLTPEQMKTLGIE